MGQRSKVAMFMFAISLLNGSTLLTKHGVVMLYHNSVLKTKDQGSNLNRTGIVQDSSPLFFVLALSADMHSIYLECFLEMVR